MHVVVTGGAGYVGSRTTACLLEAGLQVTVVDKLLYGGEGLLPWFDHPRFTLVAADIRDRVACQQALTGADAVVHMAALVGEEACQVDPEATVAINEEATTQLIRIAAASGVRRFLFISTCSNYGVSSPDQYADEATPLHPLSLYAETKIRAEQALLGRQEPHLSASVLRLGTICGLSTRMRFNLLINDMGRAAALGRPIVLYGPKAWRPFLHIRDAAEAILRCLSVEEEVLRHRVFNVVSENYRKGQLAGLVHRHFPHVPIEMKTAQSDLRDYRVSGERIAKELAFHPTHTVEQAFLEVARAVQEGLFHDPDRPLYEARPVLERVHALSVARRHG